MNYAAPTFPVGWPWPLSIHQAGMRILDAEGGLVSSPHPRRKIAIIGMAPGRTGAPWDDPTWQIWGLNAGWPRWRDRTGAFRADRWFELHPMSAQSPEEIAWMRRCPVPLYTLAHEPTVPQSIRFPLERVLAATGSRVYFTCTFAYQIALALTEGVEEIGLWGVDLLRGTARERTVEYACVSWWLGRAEALGVLVTVPDGTLLGRHPHRYGYDYGEEATYVHGLLRELGHMDRLRARIIGEASHA